MVSMQNGGKSRDEEEERKIGMLAQLDVLVAVRVESDILVVCWFNGE